MADSSGVRAGRAFIELSLNDKFSKAIDQAAKKLKDVGATITDIGKKTLAIGSAITAPLLVAAQRFAAMGEEMAKAAEKSGVGVEALSGLKYAADQAGVGFDSLTGGLAKMQKTIFAAANGSEEAKKALAGIGLTVNDLKGLKPDEQFKLISDRMSQLGDATALTGSAMAIFGKSGADLLPLLNQGAAGIEAMQARAKALGIIMSDDDAQAGKEFAQTLKDLWDQVQMLTFQIGAAVAQGIKPFLDALKPVLAKVIEWTKAHRPLIIAVLAAGAGLMLLGGILIGAGTAISLIGVALSGITAAFAFVGTVIGLIVSPVGLVIASLAGLTAYLLATTQNGGNLLAWLGGKFDLLAATATEAFGGIADALKAGDISLAMEILWAGLKLAWIQGTQELQDKWIEFKGAVTKVAIEAFYGFLDLWQIVKAGLLSGFAEASSFFVDSWHSAIEQVTTWFDGLEKRQRDQEKKRIGADLASGKITPAMAAKQTVDVDAQADQVKAARDKKDQQDAAQRQKDLEDRLAKIKAERDKRLAENAGDEKTLTGAAGENARKDIAALEDEKKRLEEELKRLRGKAGDEKKIADSKAPSLIGADKLKGLDDVVANRQNVDVKSQGIFNAAALQTLQSTTTQDLIRKATQDTAKYTKQIADQKTGFT